MMSAAAVRTSETIPAGVSCVTQVMGSSKRMPFRVSSSQFSPT